MIGVHTGAALLLCFVVGSNCTFWHMDCPFKHFFTDPTICGSDGVTYQTPCDFIKFKPSWVTQLFRGPCNSVTKQRPRKPTPHKDTEEDNEFDLDLIIDNPSINFNIHNNANNENNINVGSKNRFINSKIKNNAKNTNNINIGRHVPSLYLYS